MHVTVVTVCKRVGNSADILPSAPLLDTCGNIRIHALGADAILPSCASWFTMSDYSAVAPPQNFSQSSAFAAALQRARQVRGNLLIIYENLEEL